MKKILSLGKALNKEQQTKIYGQVGGGGSGSCIHCSATGGSCGSGFVSSCWFKTNPNPSDCNDIYSGCTGVTGSVGACNSSCHMN